MWKTVKKKKSRMHVLVLEELRSPQTSTPHRHLFQYTYFSPGGGQGSGEPASLPGSLSHQTTGKGVFSLSFAIRIVPYRSLPYFTLRREDQRGEGAEHEHKSGRLGPGWNPRLPVPTTLHLHVSWWHLASSLGSRKNRSPRVISHINCFKGEALVNHGSLDLVQH